MTREEIVTRVAEIIRENVSGDAYYETTSPPRGRMYFYGYGVEIDEESIQTAAGEIADFCNNLVRDSDR